MKRFWSRTDHVLLELLRAVDERKTVELGTCIARLTRDDLQLLLVSALYMIKELEGGPQGKVELEDWPELEDWIAGKPKGVS